MDVVPVNYKLELQPDLDAFTFRGTLEITVQVMMVYTCIANLVSQARLSQEESLVWETSVSHTEHAALPSVGSSGAYSKSWQMCSFIDTQLGEREVGTVPGWVMTEL